MAKSTWRELTIATYSQYQAAKHALGVAYEKAKDRAEQKCRRCIDAAYQNYNTAVHHGMSAAKAYKIHREEVKQCKDEWKKRRKEIDKNYRENSAALDRAAREALVRTPRLTQIIHDQPGDTGGGMAEVPYR